MQKLVVLAALSVSALVLPTAPAQAVTNCVFTVSGTTMTLTGDCTTDSTIYVPNGVTLDGAGYTITAVDPSGDHYRGAVVKNLGSTANVINLGVTASNLADFCDGGGDRLRGIMLEAASGSITNNTVTNINQGPSGCQEGNGIEVRGLLFGPPAPSAWPYQAFVSGNTVTGYQKTGILANGDVAVTLTDNTVVGPGPVGVPRAASNGVQLGFGATGTVSDNAISGNDYTPRDFVACGLLVFEASGVGANRNHYRDNERNFCNFGRGGGQSAVD